MSAKTSLDKMEMEVLFCRTERHLTPTHHDGDLVYANGVLVSFTRFEKCTRCGWERTQVLVLTDRGYEVDKPRTRYPAGYLSDQGRLSLPEVRREQMIRNGFKVDQRPKRRKR